MERVTSNAPQNTDVRRSWQDWILMANRVIIDSFSALLDAFDMHPTTLYRGVASYSRYRLIPSIGRNIEFHYDNHREERMFRLFKEKSIPFLRERPHDDWEFLAVAQHYGLPTRMLDWTWNPLVAAFFSVQEYDEEDAAVYALYAAIIPSHSPSVAPFETPGCCIYKPPHFDNRIVAQSGAFTSQDEPDQEFPTDECDVIIIPHALKPDIRHKLRILNIHTGSLFPSLDGVAKAIREDHRYN
jgi:hypothetical protein